jgi:hypothetical protein
MFLVIVIFFVKITTFLLYGNGIGLILWATSHAIVCTSQSFKHLTMRVCQKTKIFKNLSKISHSIAIFARFLKIFVSLMRTDVYI